MPHIIVLNYNKSIYNYIIVLNDHQQLNPLIINISHHGIYKKLIF